MERLGAALAGLAVALFVVAGFVVLRWVARLLFALVRLAELVAVAGVAVVVGYLVYRVLLGNSDDPRVGV